MKRTLQILMAVALPFLAIAHSGRAAGVHDRLSLAITNKYGDVFTNLTVAQILGDGLLLEHKAGQMKVKYDDLPPAIRAQYQPLAAEAAKKEAEQGAAIAGLVMHQKELQAVAKARTSEPKPSDASEDKAIEIPDQGWRIVILNPALEELEKQSGNGEFVYKAKSRDGFFVGIMVLNPPQPGTSDEDVFRYYWPKMAQLPEVDQQNVKAVRAPKFVKVSYVAAGIPNANFYFAYRGKWVDVHIAKSPFTLADAKLFSDFDAHLAYY